MKASEQTFHQIERVLRKMGQKFPSVESPTILSDIHIRVSQDSGELLVYDDDDNEITRCVVEEWIENKDDDFYDSVTSILRQSLRRNSKLIDEYGLLKPFSIVLEDDEKESISELYICDGDTIIISGELMEGLDKDLDMFFKDLMKDS